MSFTFSRSLFLGRKKELTAHDIKLLLIGVDFKGLYIVFYSICKARHQIVGCPYNLLPSFVAYAKWI